MNDENKKKMLFAKYILVLDDIQTKYNSIKNIDDCLSLLDNANLFLEKVEALYVTDTKELEKTLKSIETVDQIKSTILSN